MGLFDNNMEDGFQNAEYKMLSQKIEKLEVLNHAMWIMLQQMGCTNETFDVALAQAIDMAKLGGKISSRGLGCPACGKSAQLSSDNMIIKCIYCGNEAIINPYELMSMASAQPVQQEPVPEVPQQPVMPVQDYYQPYDVSKDLNFDDLM